MYLWIFSLAFKGSLGLQWLMSSFMTSCSLAKAAYSVATRTSLRNESIRPRSVSSGSC